MLALNFTSALKIHQTIFIYVTSNLIFEFACKWRALRKFPQQCEINSRSDVGLLVLGDVVRASVVDEGALLAILVVISEGVGLEDLAGVVLLSVAGGGGVGAVVVEELVEETVLADVVLNVVVEVELEHLDEPVHGPAETWVLDVDAEVWVDDELTNNDVGVESPGEVSSAANGDPGVSGGVQAESWAPDELGEVLIVEEWGLVEVASVGVGVPREGGDAEVGSSVGEGLLNGGLVGGEDSGGEGGGGDGLHLKI